MKRRAGLWPVIPLLLILIGCGGHGNGGDSVAGSPVAETRDNVFIAVHCEPGQKPVSTSYVERNWPALVQLVESADDYDMNLTLLMNPQWAMYILGDGKRKELVRRWEANGHEIGLHHHGPSMKSWNGYTNQAGYSDSPKFMGTVSEMMVLIDMLPASGQIKTACVNSADQAFDFPLGVIYETAGGSDKQEDLWSAPTPFTWNGQDVLQLTHARYAAEKSEVNIDLEEMSRLLDADKEDEVMGVVFHAFEYAENAAPFDGLLQLLDERSIRSSTVAQIIENFD